MEFRAMRRFRQQLSDAEAEEVLRRNTSGVLAVQGDNGYPYAVPLSYVYRDGRIRIHCARTGHKIDAIRQNDRVSFCVIDQDKIVPETLTTHFRSVIAFGCARIVTDSAETDSALAELAKKYAPDLPEARVQAEIDRERAHTAIIEIQIEHLTGKEAIELRKKP